MKLKFEKEVEDIINAIAQLPDAVIKEEALRKPMNIIGEFDSDLRRLKNDKAFPSKKWAKMRRQLSFLFEFVMMAGVSAKKVMGPDDNRPDMQAMAEETYRFIVRAFKTMSSGEALQRPEFVRIALTYGIVYLSDHEVLKLIENNKID